MAKLIDTLGENARDRAKARDFPDWMDPMLARLTHDHFTSEDWVFERKLDGERVVAYVEEDGSVRLMSRNGKCLNDTYPDIAEALGKYAAKGLVLDGEMAAFDEDGVSDFQRLQPRMQASGPEEAARQVKVFYYVFDCMHADGHDLSNVPLKDRKSLLRKAVEWEDPLRFTEHRIADSLDYYEQACDKGWEGLIAKKADAGYTHGRSANWLKFKCVMQQEFVIGGFTEPEGERKGFGALLLGFYREGKLVYAGQVGTGFDDEFLEDTRETLDRIEREDSPYDEGDPPTKGVHFVEPELVGEVEFTEWTGEDRLRHPRFQGLRRDKDPRDVHKEAESQVTEPEARGS